MNKNYYIWVGNQLKTFRKNNKLTLEEVGIKLGKTKKQIQNYENGHSRIYLDTIVELCKIYNVDYSKFVQESIKYLDNDILWM